MAEEIKVKEWVKQINVGDEIAYNRGGYFDRNYFVITKVISKTSTGSLKTENDDLIKLDGYSRKSRHHYEPVTDEIRQRVKVQEKAKELKEAISKVSFLDFTIEQMNAIMNIINEKEQSTSSTL